MKKKLYVLIIILIYVWDFNFIFVVATISNFIITQKLIIKQQHIF